MAQPRRDPTGTAPDDAANPDDIGVMALGRPGAAALGNAQCGIGSSGGFGAAAAWCVTVVVRPAHTSVFARGPRSVIAGGCGNWPMRQASGCSRNTCSASDRL